MNSLTLLSFVFFTGLVAFITWRMTRHDDHRHSKGYFLAGRSLTFPVIAGSLLMTNLSTGQMVGLNGAAFTDGLSVMAWEVVAVVSLVAMAMFFLPRFLKSGITTLPELLALRFDRTTQLLANIIFMVAYAVILLPSILYSGSRRSTRTGPATTTVARSSTSRKRSTKTPAWGLPITISDWRTKKWVNPSRLRSGIAKPQKRAVVLVMV